MNESFKNHTISQRSKIQSIFRMNLTAEKKKKKEQKTEKKQAIQTMLFRDIHRGRKL